MNHVNLIGKMSSTPKVTELANGRKIAQFTLSTKETYLDTDGNQKSRNYWHKLSAWGRWVGILEEFGETGLGVAIEGKLITRFYQTRTGEKRSVSEVEVNDLIIL